MGVLCQNSSLDYITVQTGCNITTCLDHIRKLLKSASQQAEYHTAGDHTAKLSGGVGAHSVHQQKVVLVKFLTHSLNHPRRHGESADTGGSD
jgi:hypothetical protein